MKRQLLTPDELTAALTNLNGWTVVRTGSDSDGVPSLLSLYKRLKFPNFAESLAFVNKVADLAEAADHHPDITFGWGYAELNLTTHDRGGVTDVDTALAAKIDQITTK